MNMPDVIDNDAQSPTNKTEKTSSSPESSPESSSFDNTWFHTKIKVLKARLIWKISNFGFACQEPFPRFASGSFSDAVEDKVKWKLQLDSLPTDHTLRMTLCLQSNQVNVWTKCRLIIYDCMMNEVIVVRKAHHFGEISSDLSEVICHHNDILSADKKILSNDELTVGCEVKFFHQYVSSFVTNFNPKFKCSERRFNNLEVMFKNQELSDVKIKIGTRTFDAHKAILAAASPVFLAMFKCSMTESKENSINIDDVDEETFEELLHFIYTGKVNNIEDVAYTLFEAADKYSIDTLKQKCENQLYKSLSAENAVRVLILADRHNSDWLKAQVINFIELDAIDVTETEDFESMINSHSRLLAEIIRARAMV